MALSFIVSATHSSAYADSISQLQDQTPLGLLFEAQEKNKYGQDRYAIAAAELSKQSMMRFGNGSECLASCPAGCCANGEKLMGEAALYSLLGSKANDQARQHQNSAVGACESYNQMTSDLQSCSSAVSPLSNFVPQPAWYNDDGDCNPTAPAECKFLDQFFIESPFKSKSSAKNCGPTANLPCGGIQNYFSTIKNAGDGSLNFFFKGSYKKISLNDFSDSKKLKSLGFSQSAIVSLQANLQAETKKMEKALPIRLRKTNKSEKIQLTNTPNKNDKSEDAPDTPVDEKTDLVQASEPLREVSNVSESTFFKYIKDDPIGLAKQNIFQMINIRYQSDDRFFEKE